MGLSRSTGAQGRGLKTSLTIGAYRTAYSSPDLFGRSTWPSDQGTVAAARIDGRLVFGTSSDTPVYENADRAAANEWRARLINSYPDVMRSDNIGYKPNDALFHAEATLLLRAAKENGGTLNGKEFDIHTDSEMCAFSCRIVLPRLAVELGNPTVRFVGPSGSRRTLRNGRWERAE